MVREEDSSYFAIRVMAVDLSVKELLNDYGNSGRVRTMKDD
jgi:hypothetical protein